MMTVQITGSLKDEDSGARLVPDQEGRLSTLYSIIARCFTGTALIFLSVRHLLDVTMGMSFIATQLLPACGVQLPLSVLSAVGLHSSKLKFHIEHSTDASSLWPLSHYIEATGCQYLEAERTH